MNDDNKEPIILGELKKEKSSKPIVGLILFALLIGIVFALPDLKQYITNGDNIFSQIFNKYFGDGEDIKPKNEEKDHLVLLNDATTLVLDNIRISNIKLSENTITYNIINPLNNIVMDTNNYYLEVYDASKVLIGKFKLFGNVSATSTSGKLFVENANFNSIANYYGKFVVLNSIEYPNKDLIENTLTCTKDENVYIYHFENNLLQSLEQNYSYNDISNIENYMANLNKYKDVVNIISEIKDSISTIFETDLGFNFNSKIDLTYFNLSDLLEYIDYNYYELNTNANKIDYEMKIKGFTCQ